MSYESAMEERILKTFKSKDNLIRKQQAEIDELVYELKIARQLAEEVPITAGLKVTMKSWDTLIAKHKGEE